MRRADGKKKESTRNEAESLNSDKKLGSGRVKKKVKDILAALHNFLKHKKNNGYPI